MRSHWDSWERPAPKADLAQTTANIVAALEWKARQAPPPPVVATVPLYGCKAYTPRTTCDDVHPGGPIPAGSSCYCECCARHGMDGRHPAVPLDVRPLPREPEPAPPPKPAKFKPKHRHKKSRLQIPEALCA